MMPATLQQFVRFIHSRNGNILILTAVMIPVLLSAVALAVDLNRYLKTRGYVQSAVDQAALAAVSVDGQDRNEIATRFFNASLSEESKSFITLEGLTVEETFPTGGPLSVTVSATVSMKNQFGAFVGVTSTSLGALGQATRQVENVEAVLTLASSGTMCAHKSRGDASPITGDTLIALEPDDSCTDFNAMKEGVREFMRIVDNNVTVADFRVGLVPFNFKVKMPNLSNIPPSLTANEDELDPSFYETFLDAEPLSAVVPLTSNMDELKAAVDDLEQTPEGIAWSRSDLATHVAGLMLDPMSTKYFGGGTPKDFGDPETQKIIIMMTDGANTGCCYTNWPLGNFDNQYVYFYEPYNEQQKDICRLLKQEGVEIFSILFDVSETDPGGKEINDVFARCASGATTEPGMEKSDAPLLCSDKQNCYNVADDEELIKAYRQIGQTFYKPTITQ